MKEDVADAGRSPGTDSSVWATGTSGDLRRAGRIFTSHLTPLLQVRPPNQIGNHAPNVACMLRMLSCAVHSD